MDNYFTIIVLASEHELPSQIIDYKYAKYLFTGVGMVNAAIALVKELQHNHPNSVRVLNIGTCFGISHAKPGTILQMHEVNYDIEPDLVNITKYRLVPFIPSVINNKLISGNKFVTPENYLNLSNPNVDACDMEAFAIAEVCHQFAVPLKVVKVVSDSMLHPLSPLAWKDTLAQLHESIKNEIDIQLRLDDYYIPSPVQ